MTLSEAIYLWCIGGGVVGALLRWGFPYLFKRADKQNEFEPINPWVSVAFGVAMGFGIAIFFESDLKNVEGVHIAYIKNLGLLSALFVMSTIDKLDKYSAAATKNFIKPKT